MPARAPLDWALALAPPARLFTPKPRDDVSSCTDAPSSAPAWSPSGAIAPRRGERQSNAQAVAWVKVWSKATGPPARAAVAGLVRIGPPPAVFEIAPEDQPKQTGPPMLWPLSHQPMQLARSPPIREARERKARKKNRGPPAGVAGPASAIKG